ncbi:MAG: hypothetical protein C4532_05895 [Candidatus Abyssobacteria bacterium SURF_17]|uniref:Uncharacterized protein n=1 Tax=Candidatus Abyssobacteria bacterium SURF_17 TaxID=2093361 RepID=A0A419F2F2_9BACT|nr:MAG: hypothetical protein C4532_05895 [Candidatus Abyssubacteria bacterium SURF_17]
MNQTLRYILAILLVVVGSVAIVFPEMTGYEAINEKALDIVDGALMENVRTFAVVSGIKAGLAVIEGSTMGAVIVTVEIGDLAQPVYDFVDYVWKILVYALLVLSLYKFILEFGLLSFGVRILGVGVLVGAVRILAFSGEGKTPRSHIYQVIGEYLPILTRAAILSGLLLAYLAPITVLASHSLERFLTEPVKERESEAIGEFQSQFDRLKDEFLSVREDISLSHPKESSDQIRARMRLIGRVLLNSLNSSIHAFLYYLVILFVEIIVFPLMTAFILYKFTQFAMNRFLPRKSSE